MSMNMEVFASELLYKIVGNQKSHLLEWRVSQSRQLGLSILGSRECSVSLAAHLYLAV